ncbi:hypothetical protein PybrP1_003413 [[Pythium] brassicae (nom. inval.)]|nr:hypothetical protein PybrP1_003413 [[Pythium] brassicae (nom. inval.)]
MGILKSDALDSHLERSPLLLLPPAAKSASVVNGDVAPHHLASDARTFASAIISFLGAGVLGFPFAFKQSGVLLGLALLLLVGTYQLEARGLRVATYGDIGRAAFGRYGQALVNIALVVSQMGFGVAYIIFIASNAHSYFSVPKEAVVLVCLPFLIGFSLLPHIKQLAWVALAADVMNFTGLAIVYAMDFSLINLSASTSSGSPLQQVHWLGATAGIPFFFGIASYCFSAVGMVLPLEKGMLHKSHFPRILTLTVVVIGSVYASFGVAGYLAFGESTEDVLTLNLQGHGGLATSVKLFFCAGLFFAYPMMLFPVFDLLQPAVLKLVGAGRHAEAKRVAFRSAFVLLTAAIAAGVPDFAVFISFLGSTCCSLLGFVLPVVFYLRIFAIGDSDTKRYDLKLLLAILFLGIFAVSAGFVTALSSFI